MKKRLIRSKLTFMGLHLAYIYDENYHANYLFYYNLFIIIKKTLNRLHPIVVSVYRPTENPCCFVIILGWSASTRTKVLNSLEPSYGLMPSTKNTQEWLRCSTDLSTDIHDSCRNRSESVQILNRIKFNWCDRGSQYGYPRLAKIFMSWHFLYFDRI
jgi:hypothetical protein